MQLIGNVDTDEKNFTLVTFPNKETRKLVTGPSSVISKAVIEEFATRFLENPLVLWLSESGNKIIARDESLSKKIGLEIHISQDLPDIILVDLSMQGTLLVFIEVVATDGPITDRRKEAIYQLTDRAGFNRSDIIFATAFHDKEHAAFKKTLPSITWNSFVWFVSEPDNIFILKQNPKNLHALKKLLE